MLLIAVSTIVGLYILISGKVGIGKTIYLEGRRARIAGLILLAPIPITLCLAGISTFTGQAASNDDRMSSTAGASWIWVPQIALAYVSFHVTSRETKTRGGCLTLWLILLAVGLTTNTIYMIYANFVGVSFTQYLNPSTPQWVYIVQSVIAGLNLVFIIAIWNWKKWGVFGFIVSIVISQVINLITGNSNFITGSSLMAAFLGLSYLVIVGVLLITPKWHFFE